MILLLEDDPKVAAQIKEALGEELVVCEKVQDFLERLVENPKLAIIDFDLHETDGLMVYRKLREQAPYLKTIMLSDSNNIPLAVSATRMGVADFLRKPLELTAFKAAVQSQLKAVAAPGPTLSAEWLNGTSKKLQNFLNDFRAALASNQDLSLAAERGVDLGLLARLLHKHGPNGKRKFVEFNLASFSRDTLEGHFWAALQELLLSREEASLPEQQELTGTLYFEGWENIPDHFKNSLLEFLKKRRTEARLLKDVRVMIAAGEEIKGFERLVIPPLRERKEDLPLIVAAEVRRLTQEPVYFSPRVMEFFAYYDFPGNYEELRVLLECALRNHPREVQLASFLLSAGQLVQTQLKQTLANRSFNLNSVRERFELELFTYVVQSAGGDVSQAARFLDLPRTALEERLKTLGLKTED
ncbi:MAG: response regulator [Candidatus Margulisiibacteriota bacterium]